MASPIHALLRASLTRTLANESEADRRLRTLDGVTLIKVPQTRFYTAIDLNAGATSSAGGYAKGGSAKNINFLLVHPTAVLQANKHTDMKIFSPDVNQTADSWLVQYRQYHDAFVEENKVDGIFLHKATT